MYKIQIINRETWEILECHELSLSDARRMADMAYFAAGETDEKMEISVVSEITGEVNKVIRRLDIPLVKTEIKAMITKPEIKEMFIVEPAQMPEVEAYYQAHPDPRYIGFKTANDLFEFNHPLLAKDVGLKIIVDVLEITRDEIMAFGDTTNDIEMLKYAKYGICMDNGTQDAKDASVDIAPSIHENGFAKYIRKHLQNGNYV